LTAARPAAAAPAGGGDRIPRRVRGRQRTALTPDPPAAGSIVAPHDWRAARFMVIVAHPDDADFGPAATAAGWIDAGSVGRLICCTSGDQGGEDVDLDPLELAATREAEQRLAAAVVGYDDVRFLHQPDGALANELPLRELLVREIREFRPDAILTHDPEVLFYRGGGVNHADHRAAGIAAVDAVYPAARNPMAFPSLARAGLAPHRVRRLYLFWPAAPTAWVDAVATLDRKIQALRCHPSQFTMDAPFEQRMRDWAAEDGTAIGTGAAEAFRLVVIDDDEQPAAAE
jgi:LmbE family N-acetylglucosaminyl deacetylase